MSRPALASWDQFLSNLVRTPELQFEEPYPAILAAGSAGEKYKIAQEVTHRSFGLPAKERAEIVRKALRIDSAEINIPSQTAALCDLRWPLVVSTNYDDFYLRASGLRINQVFGRSRDDCHRVLRSLDDNDDRLLWALQGFLGGQTIQFEWKPGCRLERLVEQLVIGHQQYVSATNAEPHFRRAVAELFRRRSLLFIGSGLQEDYVVNLFAEIVHHHGLGAHPHFALVSEADTGVDPWFLQTCLGITVIRYANHQVVPALLQSLARNAKWPSPRDAPCNSNQPIAAPSVYGYNIHIGNTHQGPLTLYFKNSRLPAVIGDQAAFVVSVGRNDDNSPKEGEQAYSVRVNLGCSDDWKALGDRPSYVYQNNSNHGLFAVAAREQRPSACTTEADARNLHVIPDAIHATLCEIDRQGFQEIHLGAVAAGPSAGIYPLYPMSQTLRGIRRFILDGAKNVRQISCHVVDPRVWAPIASGAFNPAELVTAELLPVRIEMRFTDGKTESLRVLLPESPTIRNVVNAAKLNAEQWQIDLVPPPYREYAVQGFDDILAPGMSLMLSPRRWQSSPPQPVTS